MKRRSIIILAAILTMTLSVAMAWPKSKKTIILDAPTVVGGVTLQRGDYIIDWTGTGPEVQVTLSQGDKTLVTVPATLEVTKRAESSVLTTLQPGGARLLVDVNMKNKTLHLAPPVTSSGN